MHFFATFAAYWAGFSAASLAVEYVLLRAIGTSHEQARPFSPIMTLAIGAALALWLALYIGD